MPLSPRAPESWGSLQLDLLSTSDSQHSGDEPPPVKQRKGGGVQVLRSDASALAADCREEAQALARRLVKLSGRRDAAERREVRGAMRQLAKEEKRRQGAAADEVWRPLPSSAIPAISHAVIFCYTARHP